MGVADRQNDEPQDGEVIEDEQQQDVQPEGEEPGEGGEEQQRDEGAEQAEGEEEVVVQIGDEEPPASEEKQAAPAWVKELRQEQKRLRRENEELKRQLQGGQPAASGAPQLPAKPKLADYDYDEDKYQEAMEGWYAKKREVDSFEAEQQARAEAAQKAVREVHENYAKSKTALKVRDYDDAEEEVKASFSEVQQSILIAGTSNPATLVYALGKTPAKLKELASIKDPVKFAVAIGKLETEVKVTPKRTSTKPAPETTVRSGSGSAATTSATLDRLMAEADRTGDRTKVAAYLRQQRAKGK